MNWPTGAIVSYAMTSAMYLFCEFRVIAGKYREAIDENPQMTREEGKKLLKELNRPADRTFNRIIFPGFFVMMITLFIGSVLGLWR